MKAKNTVNALMGLAFPDQAIQKTVSFAVESELSRKYSKVAVVPYNHKYFVFLQVNVVLFFLISIFKKRKLEKEILAEVKDIDYSVRGVFVLNKIPVKIANDMKL